MCVVQHFIWMCTISTNSFHSQVSPRYSSVHWSKYRCMCIIAKRLIAKGKFHLNYLFFFSSSCESFQKYNFSFKYSWWMRFYTRAVRISSKWVWKGTSMLKKNVVIQNKTHPLNLVSMNIKGVFQPAKCGDRKINVDIVCTNGEVWFQLNHISHMPSTIIAHFQHHCPQNTPNNRSN